MSTHPVILTSTEIWYLTHNDDHEAFILRRVVPRQSEPRIAPNTMFPWIDEYGDREIDGDGKPCWIGTHPSYPTGEKWFTCPYGAEGDTLWVKELWFIQWGKLIHRATFNPESYEYGASNWQPASSMPRKYSRLTTKLTHVNAIRDEYNMWYWELRLELMK